MRQRSQGGFTLLELAIVLFIVGLIAIGGLKAASALRENAGISETSKRLDTLVMALQTFLMKHNRLPCPARKELSEEENPEEFGKEGCENTGVSIGTSKILRGVIPSRSLGLNGDRLLDAWDRQFTYVVVQEATAEYSFTSQRWPPIFKLSRPIDNQSNQPNQLNRGNEGIVVIISHGANGSGAYMTNGKQLPLPAATAKLEWENLNDDPTFVQAAYSTHEENPFDDQVLVLTEDQIVQPLANQGALKTKHAQTLEKLKRIENALIGYMARDNDRPTDCPIGRSYRRGLPAPDSNNVVPHGKLDLDKSDIQDPWGKLIWYKPIIVTDETCQAGLYNGFNKEVVFEVRSFGPDRSANTSDDIVIKRQTQELSGILTTAGLRLDTLDNSTAGLPSDTSDNSTNASKQ